MPKESDPFREYVQLVENKWKCQFCEKEYRGSATRIRAHLAGIPRYGILACEKVDHLVRAEALQTFNGEGSVLGTSTGGTLGEEMERSDFGVSLSVLQTEDTSNPNDTQKSNQPGCAPQLPSFYWSSRTGTASVCTQDQMSFPPGDMPMDNLDTTKQPWCVPYQPSCYWPTKTGTTSACPQYQVSLPIGDMLLGNLDTVQQPDILNHRLDAAHGYEIASSLQQLPKDSSTLPSLDLSELPAHLESGREQQNAIGLSPFPNDQVPGNSGITLDAPLYPTKWSNFYHSLQDCLECSNVIINTSEEIHGLHNPMVGSSLQIDSSHDLDSANCLQDCGQPCEVEVVPVCSNTSLTDAVQHPGQVPPRYEKEVGNDTCRFPSQTPMGIDPSIASQHSSDSHISEATIVDLLVSEPSTKTIGPSASHALVPPQCQIVPHRSINLKRAHQKPTVLSSPSWKNHLDTCQPEALMKMDPCMPSSSQARDDAPSPPQILPCEIGLGPSSLLELDTNESVPIMSHPIMSNNFEKNRALKRKLVLLYSKEDSIRDELKFAASLFLKKPRMELVNWLANVEKLRNDCTVAACEDWLPLHQQVDTVMREAEDLMRQGKGLFEVREIKVSKLLEDKMVGEAFQRNTMEILECLVGNQISRLGIYGMGGVGKTTIMVHVHNRLLEKANYDNVLWITVSQDINIQRLQDDLWKVLGSGILEEKDVRKRAAKLYDRFMERGKSTLILDDVWKLLDFKEVGIPDVIKLVLTTRSYEVCRQMQCQKMIKIEPLSHTEAENLFVEELGSEVALDLETRMVVKSIVQECAGLPLAVITMARSMRGLIDVFDWKDFLEKMRESDMGQTDMEKVLMILELSYRRLGNHEVQQCFLSCALYPEDKRIDKFELIEFFIDLGLIDRLRLNTREKQYVRGFTILNKLANVCLLEVHGSTMKMHDLIRDMALRIMSATSIVKAGKGLRRIPSEEHWMDALEKVSLMENRITEFPLNMSPNCPKLSTFLMNGNGPRWYNMIICDSFFKQLGGLEVLNLSECPLRALPDSISDLVNLRALLLRNCRYLQYIPNLGKLGSLRKLDIVGCAMVEVIEGLEMLVNLSYLDLTYTKIKRLPKITSGALQNLQYLKVHVGNGEDITKLWALETLECSFEDVDNFNKFVREIGKQRNNPRYYKLNVHQEASKINVEVSGDAQFGNCERSVYIETWSHGIVSAEGESSGIFILIPQNVKVLTCRKGDGITNLADMGPLENLEKLIIIKWKNLRVLCGGQDEEIINIHDSPALTPTPLLFTSLRDLEIYQCPKVKYLFGHGSKFYLPHLQKIEISNCEEMMGITVAITSPQQHLPPAFPNLEVISVWGCDKMKRVVESEWLPYFPNLRRIIGFCCENMEEIIGGPPPYMPIEEISLERLGVEDCPNMRKLFSNKLLTHLPNLQSIEVDHCKGMVEMISEMGQGQEGSIMTPVNIPPFFQSSISLPKLKRLRLHDLPQLKSICQVPMTCDSMESFHVSKCPKMNKIPLHL